MAYPRPRGLEMDLVAPGKWLGVAWGVLIGVFGDRSYLIEPRLVPDRKAKRYTPSIDVNFTRKFTFGLENPFTRKFTRNLRVNGN